MNIFRVIGRGFKWIGKKFLWVLRRDEVLLIARFVPLPAFDEILLMVRAIDVKFSGGHRGTEKMLEALKLLPGILNAFGLDHKKIDNATMRFIIEVAVQVMKGTTKVVPMDDE